MAVSVVRVVLLCAFLFIGMVLGGVLLQPKASVDVWNIKESDFPSNGSSEDKLSFLLNYAILAPSSLNAQPWKFNVSGDEIRLFADKTRWLAVSDTDQRELYISQGTALENLLVAADYFGYGYNVTYLSGNGSLVAIIKLTSDNGHSQDPKLFKAILAHDTNQNPHDTRKIPESALRALQNISDGKDVKLVLASDANTRNEFCNLTVSADQKLYLDPNYKSELGHSLGEGMMGPTGIQAVLAQLRILFLDISADQIRKDADLVNSTPVLGFISSNGNDRISQLKAGQLLERVWLESTSMGINLQPMSQALEVPSTKAKLAKMLPPDSGNPQQVFMLGYASSVGDFLPRIPLWDSIVPMNWSQK
ncbi:MAG: hypothetical protein ACE14P_04245 [Methanotrichaceae archaeon]